MAAATVTVLGTLVAVWCIGVLLNMRGGYVDSDAPFYKMWLNWWICMLHGHQWRLHHKGMLGEVWDHWDCLRCAKSGWASARHTRPEKFVEVED